MTETDKYFEQRRNATGRFGASTFQKCTAALRVLAYGSSPDSLDEYIRLGETTIRKTFKHFCRAVIGRFGSEYLRSPTKQDIERLMAENAARGLPGMLLSLDCMHWPWKNCPIAWKGQFQGRKDTPSIILEAAASYDTWIWHAFFGAAGSNNDLNVLDLSTFLTDLISGKYEGIEFVVNGHTFNIPYWLVDGIYPEWAYFVQSLSEPGNEAEILFSKLVDAIRKDIERAFGILQARFKILVEACRQWYKEDMEYIMKACIIMHNMIVEDERVLPDQTLANRLNFLDNVSESENPEQAANQLLANFTSADILPSSSIQQMIANLQSVKNKYTYHLLRNSLIAHVSQSNK